MKIVKYFKRIALFVTNFCILEILHGTVIKDVADPSYEVIWWIAMVFLIVWYGCACWEDI